MSQKEKRKRKETQHEIKGTSHPQKVEFDLYAPDAREVYVAGDFNSWDTQARPMKQHKHGVWKARVKLPPGRYEYKFFADGCWVEEGSADEMVPNPFGTYNCAVGVE